MSFRKVAAFLWLPQFRFSMEPLAVVVPFFRQVVALALLAGGLIDKTDASLQSDAPVPALRQLQAAAGRLRADGYPAMGCAFFAALVLMFGQVVLAVAVVGASIMAPTDAQAQLFSNPMGDSSMDAYKATSNSFDMDVPAAGTAQGDYGIMLLDKVLRAGAYGKGAPIQNALRGVMEIYNTAMLVIAAFLIGWMVVSIVIDTARYGEVGGRRHNMVYAPMRIVFALALLIPLGSAGFSSGQFMILKLAEWGSNLATRTWGVYVDGVTNSDSLVASYVPENAAAYVKDLARVYVCSAAHNGQLGLMRVPERVLKTPRPDAGDGMEVYEWQLPTGGSCGTMIIEEGKQITETITGTDSLSYAIGEFKQATRDSFLSAMLAAEPKIRSFACSYVAAWPPFDYSVQETLADTPDCRGVWDGKTYDGKEPPPFVLAAISQEVTTKIQNDFQKGLSSLRAGSNKKLVDAIKERGWAGMGAWYHRIAQLNTAAAALRDMPITITGGDIVTDSYPATLEASRVIVSRFDKWWLDTSLTLPASIDPKTGESTTAMEGATQESGILKGVLTGILQGKPRKALNTLIDATGITNAWLANLVAWTGNKGDQDTYPLATLTGIGEYMADLGVLINGIMLYVHAAMAAGSSKLLGTGIDMGPFASAYVFELLPKIGVMLMVAGMMLKFYIPLIPFIRVTFAVLTWIISIFEAVVMVPVAALAHLSTDGEGLAGPARNAWILWLNVLLRPVLVVIGYIGAMLVFNGFIAFFTDVFVHAAAVGLPTKGIMGLFSCVSVAILYVFIMFTAANTIFKMLDIVPNALMRWMGGQADHSFDDHSDRGAIYAAVGVFNNLRGGQMPPKKEGAESGQERGLADQSKSTKKGE